MLINAVDIFLRHNTSMQLSVVIITYNEEKNLGRCLESVRRIADEIIVVDSNSTDKTVEIAEQYGAKVFQHPFEGYVKQKIIATNHATHNWVFTLDADEVVTPELEQSILATKTGNNLDAYKIARITNYCGKWIKHSGWYPDYITRLFDRTKGQWHGGNIHEHWELDNKVEIGLLGGHLLHYSYPTISSHIGKIEKFTELSARDAVARGKDCSLLKVLLVPGWNFFVTYILKLGILDGYYGFIICKLDSYVSFIKYAKIRQYAAEKRRNS
ncbi:MAG: glycosyltransferase family 2 protein [Sphingobacteriales bacterium]|nr:MAG: glycosyltransferase family 2 protein [Sphingobacteriales bacterium]